MAVYMITYRLTKSLLNYSLFFAELNKFEHCSETKSFWLVETKDDVAVVRDRLATHLNISDSLFVFRVGKHWAARHFDCSQWLSEPTRQWD